ncbi:MAG: hypothetical protein HY812_03245 [Planctomycetes bacterium]|nr:hypothetical protein [Planctomycetota bacterium]
MKTKAALFSLLLGGWALAGCLPEEEDAPDKAEFMRFVEDEDGAARLETAVVRYRGAENRVVDLIAAVHVGDRAYYDELNALFSTYDSLLFEAVMPKDRRPEPGGDSAVSMVQRALKDFLGLEFQLDAVDYSKDNFVHADLTPHEFQALMDEKGENLFTLLLQAILTQLKQGPGNAKDMQEQQALMLVALFSKDQARALKLVLGRQIGDLERLAAGLEKGLKGEDSVLVVERNKAALAALEARLKEGDDLTAIFYGAAHMPDMERRLLHDHGFTRSADSWLTAWDMPRPVKRK